MQTTQSAQNTTHNIETIQSMPNMQVTIREYDAKLDSKKRLTLRSTNFDYYHVQEMDNGVIVLEPRELTPPFQISANTLSMMDQSMKNLRAGNVSSPIDISGFKDL